MKQLTVIFTILTALLLATSCSKEELPGDENTDEPGQMQTYTFTVSPDLTMEGDAETRSEGTPEEMPTRCFMQILGNNISQDVQQGKSIENGSFTFSVKLPNTTYTFLFWADNGSGDTPTDLREVQYTPETVAFAARETDTPENIINKGVSLKHAVAKVTLQTTATTSASEGESIKVTTTCATIYNVDNLSASSSSAHTATKTFDTSTDFAVNDNIATFYFLPQNETQSVDVEFHLLKQTIESVPLAANTHVTLQGDLSEDNPKWGVTNEYIETKFRSYFYEDNDSPKGQYHDGFYSFKNGKVEFITALFKEITRNDSFVIPSAGDYIDITNNLTLLNIITGEGVRIDYNNTNFCIYYNGDASYDDFSDIYPGTNIN